MGQLETVADGDMFWVMKEVVSINIAKLFFHLEMKRDEREREAERMREEEGEKKKNRVRDFQWERKLEQQLKYSILRVSARVRISVEIRNRIKVRARTGV